MFPFRFTSCSLHLFFRIPTIHDSTVGFITSFNDHVLFSKRAVEEWRAMTLSMYRVNSYVHFLQQQSTKRIATKFKGPVFFYVWVFDFVNDGTKIPCWLWVCYCNLLHFFCFAFFFHRYGIMLRTKLLIWIKLKFSLVVCTRATVSGHSSVS